MISGTASYSANYRPDDAELTIFPIVPDPVSQEGGYDEELDTTGRQAVDLARPLSQEHNTLFGDAYYAVGSLLPAFGPRFASPSANFNMASGASGMIVTAADIGDIIVRLADVGRLLKQEKRLEEQLASGESIDRAEKKRITEQIKKFKAEINSEIRAIKANAPDDLLRAAANVSFFAGSVIALTGTGGSVTIASSSLGFIIYGTAVGAIGVKGMVSTVITLRDVTNEINRLHLHPREQENDEVVTILRSTRVLRLDQLQHFRRRKGVVNIAQNTLTIGVGGASIATGAATIAVVTIGTVAAGAAVASGIGLAAILGVGICVAVGVFTYNNRDTCQLILTHGALEGLQRSPIFQSWWTDIKIRIVRRGGRRLYAKTLQRGSMTDAEAARLWHLSQRVIKLEAKHEKVFAERTKQKTRKQLTTAQRPHFEAVLDQVAQLSPAQLNVLVDELINLPGFSDATIPVATTDNLGRTRIAVQRSLATYLSSAPNKK